MHRRVCVQMCLLGLLGLTVAGVPAKHHSGGVGMLWPPLPEYGHETDTSPFDIVWGTPSPNGGLGQLPLGNGNCAASVWVEPSGDILAQLQRSDAFDEATSRDKITRLRFRLSPPLNTARPHFSQHLVLANASIVIKTDTHAASQSHIT